MSYILNEKNKILSEIRVLEGYNDHSTKTLNKLKSLKESKFTTTQLEKNTKSIEENLQKIKQLNTRLEKLENGELDDELKENIKKQTLESKIKGEETIKRKKEEKKVREEDEKLSKDYYNMTRKSDRENKKWYYKSAATHFFRTSPPGWMKDELKKMPCNEGYIFKNVYFFGEKPKKSNLYKMTEARKGLKIIHCWDDEKQYIYEKTGRQPKVLISEEKRKKK